MADLTTPIDISGVNTYVKRNVKNIMTLMMHTANDMLQHMTPYPGIRNSVELETFVEESTSRRYDGDFVGTSKKGTIYERELKVRPCVYEMMDEPERYRDQYRIDVAGGLDAINNPFTNWLVDKGIFLASQDLYNVLWTAEYDATAGNLALDKAFDGVTKVLDDAITASKIAAGEGNYQELTGAFSASNIIDRCKALWRGGDPRIRRKGQDVIMYMSTNNGDHYDDNYEALHDNPPFIDQSGQMYLEGSQKKCKIVRLDNMPDDVIMLSTKRNFRYGFDKMSDMNNLKAFPSGNPYKFAAALKYIFGIQFHTFENREFVLAKVTA